MRLAELPREMKRIGEPAAVGDLANGKPGVRQPVPAGFEAFGVEEAGGRFHPAIPEKLEQMLVRHATRAGEIAESQRAGKFTGDKFDHFNHYMSAESLLPWAKPDEKTSMALADYRDIVMVAGTDPYAYKGTTDVAKPVVRADGEGGCADWNNEVQIKLAADYKAKQEAQGEGE